MWLITPWGFFSIVKKNPADTFLTVRARVQGDLDRLREQYVPELGPEVKGGGSDYQYRATVDPEALAQGMARMILDINYSNFKGETGRVSGPARAHVYSRIWDIHYDMERQINRSRFSRRGE